MHESTVFTSHSLRPVGDQFNEELSQFATDFAKPFKQVPSVEKMLHRMIHIGSSLLTQCSACKHVIMDPRFSIFSCYISWRCLGFWALVAALHVENCVDHMIGEESKSAIKSGWRFHTGGRPAWRTKWPMRKMCTRRPANDAGGNPLERQTRQATLSQRVCQDHGPSSCPGWMKLWATRAGYSTTTSCRTLSDGCSVAGTKKPNKGERKIQVGIRRMGCVRQF